MSVARKEDSNLRKGCRCSKNAFEFFILGQVVDEIIALMSISQLFRFDTEEILEDYSFIYIESVLPVASGISNSAMNALTSLQ